MNGLRDRLYPSGFRPMRFGPPLFAEANLKPHYYPFKGIGWSIVVHFVLVSALIVIPKLIPDEEDIRLDEAVMLDLNDDVLYLPLLGSSTPKVAVKTERPKKTAEPATEEGLSFPGPQPILSKFEVPTNSTQTVLQPTRPSLEPLDPSLLLPNVVRLPAPLVEKKLTLPEVLTTPIQQQAVALQPDLSLKGAEKPLAAPLAESRMKVPDQTAAVRPGALTSPFPQLENLNAPSKALAAPLVESKLKVPEQTTQAAQRQTAAAVAQLDGQLSGPLKPLAAPLVESRFKLPEVSSPIARPAIPVAVGDPAIGLSGPARPLAAPIAQSRISVPDATAATAQPSRTSQLVPLDLPVASSARPLAAPRVESRLRVPEATTNTVAPSNTASGGTARLDVPLNGQPSRALAAPVAESRIRVPEASTSIARPSMPAAPLDNPATNIPPLLALSPTPARPNQPVALPPGEARGNFAISPQPNLTFPGNEPGGKAANGTSQPAANGADVFPGITILGADNNNASNSRNTISIVGGQPDRNAPPPLQTSYGITLIASGGSGGGLPDFGVFANEQVHTVYLDMRRTIQDEPVSWTAEFGVKHREATAENERITNVGGQLDVSLPFPITKEKPAMPEEIARKYPGRLIIAYAVVNTEGKVEQLSIKQSPDPLLNESVLNALKKWTFRPARRDGEVIPAKMLLGIPVR